ncbi:hypothetical protein CONLIGDRAFT_195814 [Coniochaeta ligniaria NRRL 30616]|uniref:Homeobox domain-containing protein n=1 Tax=Coniochaeta ligniaria NRRL 30616 TaxID=1408157 RepID=A0A1J7JUV5_9PEZI|nr:hypothetical protein CONLIGDRAFT_195814 [Coniochaeta ligniaria NRRL 30616]
MGEFALSRRDPVPSSRDLLRPMRLRDGDGDEPTASPQWIQPSYGHNPPVEAALPRLPSIREMLGETEPAEFNARNGGPSPSTVADSPGPATPGGHYTHLRHGSWPRMHSLDFTTVSFEDRSNPSERNDSAEGADLGRLPEEECHLPSSPRSRQFCYSPRRAWQSIPESARDARANAFSHGRFDEPRVLPSATRPSEWRPMVAVRDRGREEELELARRRRSGEQRQHLYTTQPESGCWMTTLALRAQTHNPNDRAPISERAKVAQRAPFTDPRTIAHAAPTRDLRSLSDAFTTGFYQPASHGHSRSVSLLYDRAGPWLSDAHDEIPYRVGASGPGNPFAPPNTYPIGGYVVPSGYHVAGHLERSDGSGPLAEMAKRKKRGNLPPEAKKKMMAWFKNHLHHPYPDEETKKKWIAETGLSPEQISNYCINARRRDIKNMRHEAGLSPHMPSEPVPNGEIVNRRKRRSSDESSEDGQLMDGESDKRRRRHC